MTKKLPREIYLITTDKKSQVYTSRGRASAALKTNGTFSSARVMGTVSVYVVVVNPHGMVPLDIGEDGWTDVTHEFITANGEMK
ncbi:hypothetical protein [Microbispora sp. NPDC049633]|uniref:hypothetical protein n=1 Tax=Microbispora sp. NPDC049633 TaxID=3154355 RepID=UPI00341F1BB7